MRGGRVNYSEGSAKGGVRNEALGGGPPKGG